VSEFVCIAPTVRLGKDVKLASFINLYGCEIGDETKIGAFVEVQKNARVGRRCKISSHTFICEGVDIEDNVFIGHGVTFINDSYPRATGAGGSLQMSCASFLGSGQRIELYGDDGTLVLANPTTDYFRNFTLMQGARGDDRLHAVATADESGDPTRDSRIAPVSRLVKRFLDACESGAPAAPGFAAGYRVQQLIDAAARAHATARWVDVAASCGEQHA